MSRRGRVHVLGCYSTERSWGAVALATLVSGSAQATLLATTRLPSLPGTRVSHPVEQITYVDLRQTTAPVRAAIVVPRRLARIRARAPVPAPEAATIVVPPLAMPLPLSGATSRRDSGAILPRAPLTSAVADADRNAPSASGLGPRVPSGIAGRADVPPAPVRDSMLAALDRSVPALARVRVPTQEERDERWRVMARAYRQAHAEHRLVRLADFTEMWAHMGMGGFSVPLLGGARSRAQRARDSLVMLENARLLRRLQERADSIRHARERFNPPATPPSEARFNGPGRDGIESVVDFSVLP